MCPEQGYKMQGLKPADQVMKHRFAAGLSGIDNRKSLAQRHGRNASWRRDAKCWMELARLLTTSVCHRVTKGSHPFHQFNVLRAREFEEPLRIKALARAEHTGMEHIQALGAGNVI